MKSDILAGNRIEGGELPRSTAYYYADLERFKKSKAETEIKHDLNELSEYLESNEVVRDGPIREVPPLRDRQYSLPEYNTPENYRKTEETYSTAGTFPMPEPKEKEPLLAELEIVGRLPLTQLDSSPGVRRSRSWYFCCPNAGEEDMSRESSWRYSSLRPVTAPPAPGQHGLQQMVVSQSSGHEDLSCLRAERDSLARALAAERQRAATAARAHDARLAELHGVIAELVRRRAVDKQSRAIPEEDVSDECESTTQPAGELEDDADRSKTEQIDTSSGLSPAELPSPQDLKTDQELPEDTTDTSTPDLDARPRESSSPPLENCDTSLNLSERESELNLSTARCWTGDSCRFETPPGYEAKQSKLASRVRLRRTEETDPGMGEHKAWCAAASERLALDRGGTNTSDGPYQYDKDCVWHARYLVSEAAAAVATAGLSRAAETTRKLYCACTELEAACTAVCLALTAADRALELYDVLLALAETGPNGDDTQRAAAESVAWRLLGALDQGPTAALGGPLLSKGPWLHDESNSRLGREAVGPPGQGTLGTPESPPRWGPHQEATLRAHAARLKRDTVALRAHANTPRLFSYHDIDEDELPKAGGTFSMAEMEAAVVMEELLTARASSMDSRARSEHIKSESSRSRRRRERQGRLARASETDL